VTSDPGVDATPIWSPDEHQLLYSSQRSAPYQMYVKTLGGNGAEERLLTSPVATIATDWCRDGRHVIFTRGTAATGMDVWALPMSGDRTPFAITSGPGAKDNGACSPDGKWVAFQSNASGTDNIYVRSLSATGQALAQITVQGGTQPLWRGDGQELFYMAPDGSIMSVDVRVADGVPSPAPARRLFAAPVSLVIRRSYAVTPDGQRFLIPILESKPQAIAIRKTGN
jgi:Tol biopolymer transport system component